MTESEKRQIVSLILQALKTNSLTIEQLTDTTELSKDMYVEVSGGRKISIDLLSSTIAGMVDGDFDTLVESINKIAKDLSDGDTELLKRITGVSDKSSALTDPFKSIGTFTSIGSFKEKLKTLYTGDSSIGNYRCVLNIDSSKIPVNIQVERLELDKVCQSFTSCIQLATMKDDTNGIYLGTVCTISRIGIVSNGSVTWDKWTSVINDFWEKIGKPEGIAPLDGDGKVPSENLPESLGLGDDATDAFPGDRGKDIEKVIDNIPSPLMLPGSLVTNVSAAGFLIEYQVKDKDTGKVETGRLVLPMVTLEKAGVMSAEDKQTLDRLKDSGGSGSGFYDVTKLHPLEGGYYTLATAVAALETAGIPDDKKPGLIITFEISSGTWEDYRFSGTDISTFLTPASWERHGGGDAIKGVSVNGESLVPDETGKVNLEIERQETDATLDEESTNAIQNAPVTAKFKEIEGSSLFASDVTENDDNTVTVALKNKAGENVTEFTIPAGKGGGGEETGNTTKIALTSSVDNPILKEGGSAVLSYSYDHQYASGDDKGMSTGQKADITITMNRGSQTVYSQTTNDVLSGTYTLDLSKYLLLGTTEIYVRAVVTDLEGKKQTKQSFSSVKVITLSLTSSYNIASPISGYAPGSTASIPFTVSGTGSKMVTMYLDGVEKDNKAVTKSGQTNGSFSISMTGLLPGRHTVQMVAELQASGELTIQSESIYFDIFKAGSEKTHIGARFRFPDGRIFDETEHLNPHIVVGQYEKLQFDFIAYAQERTPVDLTVYRNDKLSQTVSVPRTIQMYSNRFTEQERIDMKFMCGETEYPFCIDVAKSSIDIEEITADLTLKLIASGRSNTEGNPASWSYENVETSFTGFDWKSNGWTGDTLKLTNGASIDIDYRPFSTDATTNGATYEFELKCSNVTDRNGIILSCMSGGIGFQVTTQEARMLASGGSEVSTLFASDLDLKIAFVINPKSPKRLLELYVNGIRCGGKQYAATESFRQEEAATITVHSDAADVDLKNLRVYKRSLTDDEELTNYFVDRPTAEEMVTLFRKNDVMNDEGTDVDIEKLRAQGKSVMLIVGDVDLVNATNNKKFEVPVHVYFYSKYGKEYDFILRNAGLRIQGTSSTTYPRKNYRIYFERSGKYGTTLEVNGVNVPDLTYSFKPGARPVSIFCFKADFSDSSSTHNTGAVRLVCDVWRKCGFLTPPQAAYTGPYDVRIGVDGEPFDLFCNEAYYGKYNFNNEKSDSHIVYGFEGIEGFNDAATLGETRNKCICLEFLNNSHPLCLFGTSNITAENFAEGLEFRFKPDREWEDADEEDKAAVRRLWEWVQSCKGNPAKFAAEVTDYFDVNFLCGWYLITDYLMGVDSRAKNMMFSTWDGLRWYILPYDMDTLLGVRNDSVLKYGYIITHETFDDSIGSYAFAGHDSVLWDLVRTGLKEKLMEVAGVIRSNMSTEEVLEMFNVKMMGNWCERIYNKDGEFKYITPLIEGVETLEGAKFYDYLYAMQGSRYAHRTFMIKNRFALLDAQYVAGTYRQDSFACYFGYKFSTDNRKLKITALERYYFGYGYTSGTTTQSAVLAEDEDSTVELTFKQDLIVNDPQYIYGASKIKNLDLTDVSHAILQTLNLNTCRGLQRLDVSCSKTQTTLNAILVNGCKNLRYLAMAGLKSTAFTNLDLSENGRLETFIANKTALAGVTFASGAPLSRLVLPSTVQTLELRNLNKLSNNGITFESVSNLTRLLIEDCVLISWNILVEKCVAVKYLRVTGIDMEGDRSFLSGFQRYGGVDENGANTARCCLLGEYRLNIVIENEELESLKAYFDGLKITMSLSAFINEIDKFNSESYGGEPYYNEITLENINEVLEYYNGESYNEYLERFIEENMDINDLINK